MADSPTTYKNEIRHYPGADFDLEPDVYADEFWAGDDAYAARAVRRARTRYKNESRFKDEDAIS